MGTPGYIAPELAIDGVMNDPRSDLYALGVVDVKPAPTTVVDTKAVTRTRRGGLRALRWRQRGD